MNNELTYWTALACMRDISVRRKNSIYVECYKLGRTITDLFDDSALRLSLGLTAEENLAFERECNNLPQTAFVVDELLNQGYQIIPMTSPLYPSQLKVNLKVATPTVLYAKGNAELLGQPKVAIVGSRNADDVSLTFTANVAHNAADDNQVVISGFAKGVDRQALDAALSSDGRSIIVLPQGITTFSAGYKQYYKPMVQGRLLVVSEFMPDAGWNVGLAMARNVTIYAMADRIYVAQSDSKGGTWEGVNAGLEQKRQIYVRMATAGEKNANNLLIAKGAIPVDEQGQVITDSRLDSIEKSFSNDEAISLIREKLQKGTSTPKQIGEALGDGWTPERVKKVVEALSDVEKFKVSGRIHYRIKGAQAPSLFDD